MRDITYEDFQYYEDHWENYSQVIVRLYWAVLLNIYRVFIAHMGYFVQSDFVCVSKFLLKLKVLRFMQRIIYENFK